MTTLLHHAEARAALQTPADAVFARLDDPLRLAAHMTRRNWMMAGSRMGVETDAERGRAVGSSIRLRGRVLWVELELTEKIVERRPPLLKVWETTGEPTLLVIGAYRMGFEITPRPTGCELRVFIDYARPRSGVGRWLGFLLGPAYARWCTRRMIKEAEWGLLAR